MNENLKIFMIKFPKFNNLYATSFRKKRKNVEIQKEHKKKTEFFLIYLAYIDIYTMATVTPLNQKKHCIKNKKTLCQYNICFILTQF
jgi:hypothetical protein